MNWIERMYDLKGRDLYSQNGEGFYLEYIFHNIWAYQKHFIDIGSGDGFYLSNTKHLIDKGWYGLQLDKQTGSIVDLENIYDYITWTAEQTKNKSFVNEPSLVSIDIDGNDYWILEKIIKRAEPLVIIAEFNPAFTDSRTIKYNPDHIWDGTDYYGFSFEAGVKLAETNGYKVIFQIADMNMIMVRHDLINVSIPPVAFKQNNFFEMSHRLDDWVFI